MYYLFFISAYLAGSIPFGKLIGLFYGVDIQKRGSGNIGFANVKRILGWQAGIATLIGDIAKGAVPTLVAYHYYGEQLAFIVGVLAVTGHVYTIWLKFRGGKGIATGLGLVAVLQPLAAAVGLFVYLISCWHWKQSSAIASLVGVGTVVGLGICFEPSLWWQYCGLLGIALFTLRHNLRGTVPDYEL